jgi:hypothetical protein
VLAFVVLGQVKWWVGGACTFYLSFTWVYTQEKSSLKAPSFS